MKLPHTALAFLWHFVQRQYIAFSIIIFTAMIWVTNETFFPFFLKLIVNKLQNFHGDPHTVYSYLSGVLILLISFWVVTEILLRIQGLITVFAFPRFRANIRETVFNYVKSHSHEYFSNNFAGRIAQKLADLPTSCQAIMEMVCFNFITALVGACIVLFMMWHTKPIFALIIIIWLCLHIGLTSIFIRFGNQSWSIHSDAVSVLSGKIVDIFTNIPSMRLFARGEFETNYLKTFQADEIAKSRRAMLLMELTRIGLGMSGLFLIFSMIFLLIYSWANHWISIGDFTQVGMQTFWLLGWIWFVSFQMTVFARELGTINGALSIITKGHDVVDCKDAVPLHVTKGEICFDRVTFNYQKNLPIFNDLNVKLIAGQKVGLVGYSGSGKSTFVNLILRFYDLNSGRILIDNQNIAQVTQDSLRSQIAMIPQDPSLFHRTLMENIRYGRLDASDEEVIAAAKLAHCHEFIEVLEDKYQALVGERGIKLSGGQRQRIAIARAILKNAPILILDEATSSLDSVTEKLIQESLQLLMKNRTTIVIAHRLSTLADMDRILVFHKGKIIEEGTKEELLAAKSHFAMLWNMQTDGFLPERTQD